MHLHARIGGAQFAHLPYLIRALAGSTAEEKPVFGEGPRRNTIHDYGNPRSLTSSHKVGGTHYDGWMIRYAYNIQFHWSKSHDMMQECGYALKRRGTKHPQDEGTDLTFVKVALETAVSSCFDSTFFVADTGPSTFL